MKFWFWLVVYATILTIGLSFSSFETVMIGLLAYLLASVATE